MKKLFNRLALDVKFSRAGEGHTLDGSDKSKEKQPSSKQSSKGPSKPPARPSEAAMVAGSVTVDRVERQQQAANRTKTGVSSTHKATSSSSNTQPNNTSKAREEPVVTRPPTSSSAGEAAMMRFDRQQSKEGEKKRTPSKASTVEVSPKTESPGSVGSSSPGQRVVEVNPLNVTVYLVCPNCKKTAMFSEMGEHMESCLQEVYLKDPLYGSVLMIHTLCKNQEKRKTCIETLCRYLENISEHPNEDKYRKIRISNKAFQERVVSVNGALLFLEAVGFKQSILPHNDGEEQFYVLNKEDCTDESSLVTFTDLLKNTEPVKPTLDRGLKVFKTTSRVSHNIDLPPDFYHVTAEEIKREQKARTEQIERDQLLLTKAMRERHEVKSILRYYRFSLIRVRTPDNYILQGTFRPSERFSQVRQFVLDALACEAFPFNLVSTGQTLSDDNATLAELGLAPAAVLNLSWVSHDMTPDPPCLRPELLQNIEEL